MVMLFLCRRYGWDFGVSEQDQDHEANLWGRSFMVFLFVYGSGQREHTEFRAVREEKMKHNQEYAIRSRKMEKYQNNKTTSGLELEKIKEIWAGLALTAAARGRVEAAEPILAERELSAALRETTESRQLLEKFGTPPLVSLEGMEQILLIAEKGDMLAPEQLEQAEAALSAVRRMQDYLTRGQQYQIPLAYYGENLQPLGEIREQIHRQIRGGQVEDRATRELLTCAARSSALRRSARKRRRVYCALIRSACRTASVSCAAGTCVFL